MSAYYYGHMGNDDMVCDAARVSFDKRASGYSAERNARLLRYLVAHNHLLPFRHPQVSFRMSAPLFVARQLGKHQVGLTWSEVSRRYVTKEPEIYRNIDWRQPPRDNIKQGSGEPHLEGEKVSAIYRHALQVCEEAYKAILLYNVAPEQARAILPQSMMVSWLWTGSLLAWAHLYRERTSEWAQQETSATVGPIGNKLRELFPISWPLLTQAEPGF